VFSLFILVCIIYSSFGEAKEVGEGTASGELA